MRQFPPEWYAHQAARRKRKESSGFSRDPRTGELVKEGFSSKQVKVVDSVVQSNNLGTEIISDSLRKEYSHIQDIDKIRPRYFPTPKTDMMSSTEGTRHFDLYTQDQANDIMVDKYGAIKGHKMWEESINHGGAMYSISAKIANEKLSMLRGLGKSASRDYFLRSYLDIWNEWSPSQSRTINRKSKVSKPGWISFKDNPYSSGAKSIKGTGVVNHYKFGDHSSLKRGY